MFRSGTTTFIILNEKINDIMKVVKLFRASGLLIKGVSQAKQLKMKQKNRKDDF